MPAYTIDWKPGISQEIFGDDFHLVLQEDYQTFSPIRMDEVDSKELALENFVSTLKTRKSAWPGSYTILMDIKDMFLSNVKCPDYPEINLKVISYVGTVYIKAASQEKVMDTFMKYIEAKEVKT